MTAILLVGITVTGDPVKLAWSSGPANFVGGTALALM